MVIVTMLRFPNRKQTAGKSGELEVQPLDSRLPWQHYFTPKASPASGKSF